LFIIGNGFDLYHDIKSSYADFYEWLIKHNSSDFVKDMESMFPTLKDGKPLLWQDFEEAIGRGNPLKIHQDFFHGMDDGLFDKEIQNRVLKHIKPTLEEIPILLKEWAKSLLENVKEIRPIPGLIEVGWGSLFLTFNYTMLLENVYLVPEEQILHIHNSIEQEKPIITGHRQPISEDQEDSSSVNVEYSAKHIAKALNGLYKPVEFIIKEHRDFFDSLSNITNVIVFGFSISSIDRDYFNEVFHHVHDNAKWFFISKDEENREFHMKLVDGYNDFLKKEIGGSRYYRKMKQENCQYVIADNELKFTRISTV